MKIVVSPAKSLDYNTKVPFTANTEPLFVKESKIINAVLKEKTPVELMELMKISSNLAELNWQRNQERIYKKTKKNEADFRPAVYAFSGDVYVGLDAYSLSENKIARLQESLRILSGLYGILRPLDEIEPYRLEMGTKMPIGDKSSLPAFWKPIIVDYLNKEMAEGEVLVNLASNEYFSAIDQKKLKASIVVPEFKELREGKLKTISFYAKKARGMMVRYIIDNDIQDVEGLKKFNLEGYAWSEGESTANNLIFTR